jgi:hypothetical protein
MGLFPAKDQLNDPGIARRPQSDMDDTCQHEQFVGEPFASFFRIEEGHAGAPFLGLC